MLLKDIGSRRQFPNFTFARQKKLNEARARKVVSDILENAGEAALEVQTVESFLREWLQQKENENTRERYKLVVDRFLSCMGKKSKSLISNISHRDILRFIKSRKDAGLASKTVLVDTKVLGTAFRLAMRLGMVTPKSPGYLSLLMRM